MTRNGYYSFFGKRLFDLALAVTAYFGFAPIMSVIAILISFRLGRPVFFLQKRPGLNGRPFTMIKFRTMSEETDGDGNLLPDTERLTVLGRYLRKTSMDELPELINVIRGEMSCVGPRPLLMQYMQRYTLSQARRLELKPGITGWAQVNGRNTISWEKKFELDLWYVDNSSFNLDLKIIAMTVQKVFKISEINQPGQATVLEFIGS